MTRHELRISNACLHRMLARLEAAPHETLTLPIHLATFATGRRWFMHSAETSPPPDGPIALVRAETQPARMRAALQQALRQRDHDIDTVSVTLGIRAAVGHVAAAHQIGADVAPMRDIVIVGPSWFRLAEVSAAPEPRLESEDLSRTRAALGGDVFRKLRQLHIGLIGCGRSGSLSAEHLGMLGVRRLTLVDPDRLERHNLGEMSCVHDREVGMHKVDALAGGLRRIGFARAEPIAKSVLSFAALGALKQADVIMACADSPAPRLAAAILATAYLQPCLDVGTGILNRAGARDMGADVRLLLPGRCAWCVGGVPRWPAARDALLLGDAPPVPADFREQRMGSLRSLNSLAVSLAMTLLEQYASNRLRDSVWLQADVSEHGLPSVVARHARKVERCPICALAGLGDSALALLPGILRQLH